MIRRIRACCDPTPASSAADWAFRSLPNTLPPTDLSAIGVTFAPLAAAVFLRLTDTARLGETRRWEKILAKSLQISLPARYLLPLLSKITF